MLSHTALYQQHQSKRPTITTETTTSGGVVLRQRSAFERLGDDVAYASTTTPPTVPPSRTTTTKAASGPRCVSVTRGSLDPAMASLRGAPDETAATPWPVGTRRCMVKPAPRIFLTSTAPVRMELTKIEPTLHAAPDAIASELVQLINSVRACPEAFVDVVRGAASELVGGTRCTAGGMALKTAEGRAAYEEAATALTMLARSGSAGSSAGGGSTSSASAIGRSGAAGDSPRAMAKRRVNGGTSRLPQLAAYRLNTPGAVATRGRLFEAAMLFAARDHALDIGSRGLVTHRGSFADATAVDRVARYGAAPGRLTELLTFAVKRPLEILLQLLVCDGDPSRHSRATLLDPKFTSIGIAVEPHVAHGVVCVLVLGTPNTIPHNSLKQDAVNPLVIAERAEVLHVARVRALSTNPSPSQLPASTIQPAPAPLDVRTAEDTQKHERALAIEASQWMDERHEANVKALAAVNITHCPTCNVAVEPNTAVYGPRGRAYHTHCLLCRQCKSTLHSTYYIHQSPLHPSSTTAHGAQLPATFAEVASAIEVSASDTSDTAGQPYCLSCLLFRLAPTCTKCGVKTAKLDWRGTPIAADLTEAEEGAAIRDEAGPQTLHEHRVDGKVVCRACYDTLTELMATV